MLRQTILILFRLFLLKFDFSVYKQNIASISLTALRIRTKLQKSIFKIIHNFETIIKV